MQTAVLKDRVLVSIVGPEAEHFLQNILTVDLDALRAGEAKPGALLSPQGKILFDFLVSRAGEDGFLLECRADVAENFRRRLMLYKLRAKVQIDEQDQALVAVSWDGDSGDGAESVAEGALIDARFTAPSRVFRHYGAALPASATETDWLTFRIASGIPESGDDYALGDAFPHDVLLDQTDGVGFRKGCYVGQEVVSRMQHRGTARRRFLIARGDSTLPAPGTDITAGGRVIGALGSVAGDTGLVLVRIDKVKAAMDAGQTISAGEVALSLTIPAWAHFSFPEQAAAEDA